MNFNLIPNGSLLINEHSNELVKAVRFRYHQSGFRASVFVKNVHIRGYPEFEILEHFFIHGPWRLVSLINIEKDKI